MTVKKCCVRVCTLSLTMTEEKLMVVENKMLWRVLRPVVPTVRSTNPMGSATSSQGIRGYISVILTLKFIYCVNKGTVFVKNNSRTSLNGDVFISHERWKI
jgi:hypothetical protein